MKNLKICFKKICKQEKIIINAFEENTGSLAACIFLGMDLFLFNPVEIILIIQVFLDMVFGLKHIIVISMKCERRNVLCCMLSMWQLDWERGL